jgi:hypothetical protein
LAKKAGISPQEITAKCDRLQSLIQSGHQSLAAQLIQEAEPWLLQTILDGCRTNESTFHLNRFFEKTPDDKADFLFLLTASRAQKMGCCPKSIALQNINNIEISAKTSTDLQFILEDILTSLPKLQQLILNLGAIHASTDSFPQLPNLTRLQIRGDEEFKTKLTITKLDIFPSLALLSVESLGNFSVCERLDDAWNRVRLETGCNSFLESGLFSLREPPLALLGSICDGCRSLNDHSLSVFLYMQRDWSSFEDPPNWWHSYWSDPPVRSQVAGKIVDFNWPKEEVSSTSFSIVIEDSQGILHPHPCPLGHKNTVGITSRVGINQIIAEPQGRVIDLIGWTILPVNQARMIARANVPVRMESNLLSRDVICAFGDFAGELEVHGRINDKLLCELMHIAFSKLEIELESFGPETFQILEKFRGRCIAIRLGKPLKATDCQSLSRCKGELVLRGFDWPTVTHLDAKAAAALCHRPGRLHLDRSLHLTVEAILRLADHPGVELGNHRQILKRKNKNGETLVTILRFYDPLTDKKEVLRVIEVKPSGIKKISDERFHQAPLMECVTGKFLLRGYSA